jgi:hypothetical protein
MEYIIRTCCDPCTIKVRVRLDVVARSRPATVALQVYDPSQAYTVLADRQIRGQAGEVHECFIPVPVSPWETRVRILLIGEGSEAERFSVLEVRKMGLATYMHAIDWRSPEVAQAISLGNRFCYNMGILPTLPVDRAYGSPDGSLKIKYLPVLDNPTTGQESVTPMRISDATAIMEASQKKCVPFTVPGRAVMFFHEFSHKYENQHPEWELEADLNGLTIYLALGYSRYEALQVYRTVFHQVDTPENRDRLANISDFINNFESLIKHQKTRV